MKITLAGKGTYARFAGIAAAILTVVLVFHVYGASVWEASLGHSLFSWLYGMWSTESTEAVDYSHGLVIPFVSAWLLWRQRQGLQAAWQQDQAHALGIGFLVVGLAMHAAGLRMQIPHLSALGFIVVLWSVCWTFGGKSFAGACFFPLAFLGFAIPIGFLAHATFPLRQLGAIVSTWVLNGIGIPTLRMGTAVVSSAGQGFALDVADACSGIRSIMALMALTAAYAYVFRTSWFARWFLFGMSLPVAAVANTGRIITIAVVARFVGQDMGMKIYHDYSGYLVFVLAVLLIVALNALIDKCLAGGQKLRRTWRSRGKGQTV